MLGLIRNNRFRIENQKIVVGDLILKKSITFYFYQFTGKKGSTQVKVPIGFSAILIFENDDKCFFLWLFLGPLYTCGNKHPHRVSKYRRGFDELNIHRFDFTDGYKCGHAYKRRKLNKLTIYKFEFSFTKMEPNGKMN